MDVIEEVTPVFAQAQSAEPSVLAALGLAGDGEGAPYRPVPILTFELENIGFHRCPVCGRCGKIDAGVHEGTIAGPASIARAVEGCARAFAEAMPRGCPIAHGRAVCTPIAHGRAVCTE